MEKKSCLDRNINRQGTNQTNSNSFPTRLERSRSQRILWLLEECAVSYDVKVYKRQATQLADPELKKIHPLGKSPVISIDAPGLDKPLVLAESGLITEYLAEHFATQLVPAHWRAGREGQVGGETEAWLRYRFFLHYAEGSLMALLLTYYLVKSMTIHPPPLPFLVQINQC